MSNFQFFATCPRGLESLLLAELSALGAAALRETVAGVYFEGELALVYRVCLWSRLANKILLPLKKSAVTQADHVYDAARQIPWHEHLRPAGSLIVDFTGTDEQIRHTQFGAQRVKDGIVDAVRESSGERPSVDRAHPDYRINAHLHKQQLTVSLDLSGSSLHKRGYRVAQGEAPLKENLAAALLIRAGWPAMAAQRGALLDPMCGSGTFLIEAAFMAADIAPGLLRTDVAQGFGFEQWLQHQSATWQTLIAEAKDRKQQGLSKPLPEIRGYDHDGHTLFAAEQNIVAAGVDDWVRVIKKDIRDFKKPTHIELTTGLVITNPPYGERLGDVEQLRSEYQTLGQVFKQELPGWQAAVFTGNAELGTELRLRPKKKYQFLNGTIPSTLLLFDLVSAEQAQLRVESQTPPLLENLSPGAVMLYNRLQKNRKQLSKWLQQQQLEAYRLYDADMPEYAAAIDVYGEQIHIQEYAAPKTIDPAAAAQRFRDILQATACVFAQPVSALHTKIRQRNPGKQQYEKLGDAKQSAEFAVQEGQARLLVNLQDYLDSGLFLDHRPLRLRIGAEAAGKRFLNLFCYTATASVHAALGGASHSLSLDMSNTYLDWAERNYRLNGIDETQHQLRQVDCLAWLAQADEKFDLILLDPPSFSNSKRMQGVLDVQRDHVNLIQSCVALLSDQGALYFSTNLRTFKLDEAALSDLVNAGVRIDNISSQTIDRDFAGNAKIHQCWRITANYVM
jgi:23S rRNA (guanine2445-N2)-methyltransferase / 23S rRNA (guanine2069-N7)-methyltransferase